MAEEPTGTERATFLAASKRSDAIWAEIAKNPAKFRLLTGDRPTGSLHLGHYFGTLKNRVQIQNKGIEAFIVIADYQVLTDRDAVRDIDTNVKELVLDYLAAGLDPEKNPTHIFCHSQIPELNQLLLPFLTLVSIPELERNPTVKEEVQAASLKVLSGAMLTYPVHQAADILFCKGNIVPVGKDQLPHLEISRKIARRFNDRFAGGKTVFPEPDALLAEVPHILGLDGSAKMSKSRGNAIFLKSSPEETTKAIKKAKTDSERQITYDQTERPEVANLLDLLSLCTDQTPQQWADQIGDGGSGTLKKELAEAVNSFFQPMRTRRSELEQDPGYIAKILKAGNDKAREEAVKTLSEVRSAMNMSYEFS